MAAETDLDRLQGTWLVLSVELDGQKYPPGGATITMSGTAFVSLNMGERYEGVVSVNERLTPKTFDLSFTEGPHAGKSAFGIYDLDGDRWQLCLGLVGKGRPTHFAALPGTGHALEVLRRQPAASAIGAPAAGDDHSGPVEALEGEWQMVSCSQDGQPMDQRIVASMRRVFRGSTTTVFMGAKPFMTSRFSVSVSRNPCEISYVDLHQHGIYEVTGDTLTTAMVGVTEDRAPDFDEVVGRGQTVSHWRRSPA